MTIAGDADEIEVGFDTETADSDNAAVAVRNVASKTKQTRDGEDPFNVTLNNLMIEGRKKMSKNRFNALRTFELYRRPRRILYLARLLARSDPSDSLHPIVKPGCDGAPPRTL